MRSWHTYQHLSDWRWQQTEQRRDSGVKRKGPLPFNVISNTPGEDTRQPSFRSHESCYHPSPVVRMAAAHERHAQLQRDAGAHQPVAVVGGGSSKLPIWLPGEEKDNRGFYWSTKQYIQNAWRQYILAEGIHAPRTFKSLISPQLVPAICAETEIPLSDWEHLSDRVLLERIEDRLKPKNSTDVINRLRELKISRDTSKGTLSQRYRVYAETFMQRLAEAMECGCTPSTPGNGRSPFNWKKLLS